MIFQYFGRYGCGCKNKRKIATEGTEITEKKRKMVRGLIEKKS